MKFAAACILVVACVSFLKASIVPPPPPPTPPPTDDHFGRFVRSIKLELPWRHSTAAPPWKSHSGGHRLTTQSWWWQQKENPAMENETDRTGSNKSLMVQGKLDEGKDGLQGEPLTLKQLLLTPESPELTTPEFTTVHEEETTTLHLSRTDGIVRRKRDIDSGSRERLRKQHWEDRSHHPAGENREKTKKSSVEKAVEIEVVDGSQRKQQQQKLIDNEPVPIPAPEPKSRPNPVETDLGWHPAKEDPENNDNNDEEDTVIHINRFDDIVRKRREIENRNKQINKRFIPRSRLQQWCQQKYNECIGHLPDTLWQDSSALKCEYQRQICLAKPRD